MIRCWNGIDKLLSDGIAMLDGSEREVFCNIVRSVHRTKRFMKAGCRYCHRLIPVRRKGNVIHRCTRWYPIVFHGDAEAITDRLKRGRNEWSGVSRWKSETVRDAHGAFTTDPIEIDDDRLRRREGFEKASIMHQRDSAAESRFFRARRNEGKVYVWIRLRKRLRKF